MCVGFALVQASRLGITMELTMMGKGTRKRRSSLVPSPTITSLIQTIRVRVTSPMVTLAVGAISLMMMITMGIAIHQIPMMTTMA